MITKNIIFALSMFLCITPVFAQTAQPTERTNTESDSYINKSTDFSVQAFNTVAKSFVDKNFIFSPFESQLTLSMLGNLFIPAKANEVSNIFGFNNMESLNRTNGRIISQLTDTTRYIHDIPSIISNAIWFNNGVRHNKTAAIREYYKAKISHGDLSSPDQIKSINSWIKKSLGNNNRIPNFSAPEGTSIIINSLLYFNQQWGWDYHFSGSYNDKFATPAGQRNAMFMDAEIEANYTRNDKYESAILELTKYKVVCILPADQDINSFARHFEADDYRNILINATKRSINLTFPIFNIETGLSLLPLFKKYGINPSSAIATNLAIPLTGLQLQQQSTIRVNQTGIAAGSVTSLYVVMSAPDTYDPIELKFNRPFIFFIIDPETKSILFAGQYTGPEA